MTIQRDELDRTIDQIGPELVGLARKIHENPELRYQEHQAAAWVAELVERLAEVRCEKPFGGLETALRAQAGRTSGPRIAILAEYDALPQIGHACGHNLIAAGAVGAFVALARLAKDLPGTIELIGTPAEEGGGGKVRLLEAKAFEGVDAAMMYHPFDRDVLAHPALASLWITMTFRGAPSHAAMGPWDGSSALTACMDTFRLIDGQRIHFRDGVRVHGYITNGGQAVNIIPELAQAEFSVRAPDSDELQRVRAIVERCARGAALASGVEVQLDVRVGYREMRNNMTIAERFGSALAALGRSAATRDSSVGAGSTDMGDLSLAVPAIHPYLAICDRGQALCHQHAFADAAKSSRGFETMLVAAKAMARTALDLLEDSTLLANAKREFAGSAPAV